MRRYFALLAAGACLLSLPAEGVTPVPAGPLIEHPASSFDLENKLLRFTPRSAGGYDFEILPSAALLDRGNPIPAQPNAGFRRGFSWRVALPFAFPFAGGQHNAVFLNGNGNLTFENPESALYDERDTWPDASMRSVAGALDVRAIAGRERMIAPLWALYSYFFGLAPTQSTIYSRATADEYVATWDSVRYTFSNEGYASLGRNQFQVRLTPNGTIEIRYASIAEKDGVVGIFTGRLPEGASLDHFDDAASDATDPLTEILSVDVTDVGTSLRFSLNLANNVPSTVSAGDLYYRVFVTGAGEPCELGYHVSRAAPRAYSTCSSGTAQASGSRVDVILSKLSLGASGNPSWGSDAAWFGNGPVRFDQAAFATRRPLILPNRYTRGLDLSGSSGPLDGNIYEVFHYPFVPKGREASMRQIYRSLPANDDMAVVLTDFRIDDIHNHGSSTGAINLPIQGIGTPGANPRPGPAGFGSAKLQVATGPIYLGPRFSEQTSDGVRTYRNYAFAVGWMAHELTHRWAAFLKPDNLIDTGCFCHWSDWLHTPSLASVASLFSDTPYTETSPMGGNPYTERPDGTFERGAIPYLTPTGMSALDLYTMGLIPPSEVPDTFVIQNPTSAGGTIYRGTKQVVRIADVVAASGARNPTAASAQRSFTLGMYLLHEDGRPPEPDKLTQARGIESALIQYFSAATRGRMTVASNTPAGAPARLRSVSGDQQAGTPGQRLANPWVVEALDADGNPVPSVRVDFTATNGTLSAATATTDARGRASVTVTLGATGATTVVARAAGVDPLQVSFPIGGTQRPAIAAGGITDAFNYQPGIASSSWITIVGTNLSSATLDWTNAVRDNRLPTELGGVRVTVNGRAAVIYFVSPGQVNVIAPLDDTLGDVSVVVSTAAGDSAPATVRKTATLPSFYAPFAQNGRFFVTAVAADGTYVGKRGLDPRVTRGARPGEVLFLFGSGFGRTNPQVPVEQIPAGAPALAERPVLTLGGRTVEFAGSGNLVLPAFYQFNITVPDLPPGDYALTVTAGGRSGSGTVFLTIGP